MKNDYLIHLIGTQLVDGEEDKIELTALGSYIKKDDTRYILYSEYPDDACNLKNGKMTSVLKVKGEEKVTVIKNNQGRTTLVLEKGKRNQCYYATEYGSMMIGVYTKKIESNLTDSGGTLEVSYSIDINSSIASFNKIFVKIKELNKKDVECDETINRKLKANN